MQHYFLSQDPFFVPSVILQLKYMPSYMCTVRHAMGVQWDHLSVFYMACCLCGQYEDRCNLHSSASGVLEEKKWAFNELCDKKKVKKKSVV